MTSNTMSRYRITANEPNQLELATVTQPKARGRQLLIKIHATSMNPHDWKFYEFFQNLSKKKVPLPRLSLGHDVAGEVIAIGSRVKNFKVGDEIFSMSLTTGAFGEYITIDERMVAQKPKGLSYEEAAVLPMAALTAHQAFKLTALGENQKILIIGGSGGVGSQAIQQAKIRKAQVTTVCSTRNSDLVKSLGANSIIDYTQQDFKQLDERFDIVFDTVGNESTHSVKHLIKPGGRFATLLPNGQTYLAIVTGLIKSLVNPNAIKTHTLLALPIGRQLEKIAQWVDAGQLHPLIDKTFALEDLLACMEYSKEGRTRGKLAISVTKQSVALAQTLNSNTAQSSHTATL